MFQPAFPNVYIGHTAIKKEARGRKAVIDGKKCLKWMFDNTDCKKIIGFTPEMYKPAMVFNRLVGFKKEGRLTKSLVHEGGLRDMIIFGLCKDEV